jgi:hypothetical protein
MSLFVPKFLECNKAASVKSLQTRKSSASSETMSIHDDDREGARETVSDEIRSAVAGLLPY